MPDAPARIATVPVPVVLTLADGTRVDVTLRLVAEGDPPAPMPVETLLDGPRDFLAVSLPGVGSALVNRGAVVTLEMAADAPGAPAMEDGDGGIDIVTLHLESACSVSGVLRVRSRDAGQRTSDIFNTPGGWVVAGLGDRIVLVNKARIVRVSF
jgi:hypothetical protein